MSPRRPSCMVFEEIAVQVCPNLRRQWFCVWILSGQARGFVNPLWRHLHGRPAEAGCQHASQSEPCCRHLELGHRDGPSCFAYQTNDGERHFPDNGFAQRAQPGTPHDCFGGRCWRGGGLSHGCNKYWTRKRQPSSHQVSPEQFTAPSHPSANRSSAQQRAPCCLVTSLQTPDQAAWRYQTPQFSIEHRSFAQHPVEHSGFVLLYSL